MNSSLGGAAAKEGDITKLAMGFLGLEECRCWQWMRGLVVHEEERGLAL